MYAYFKKLTIFGETHMSELTAHIFTICFIDNVTGDEFSIVEATIIPRIGETIADFQFRRTVKSVTYSFKEKTIVVCCDRSDL